MIKMTVTVSGRQCCGKTTLIELFKKTLASEGLTLMDGEVIDINEIEFVEKQIPDNAKPVKHRKMSKKYKVIGNRGDGINHNFASGELVNLMGRPAELLDGSGSYGCFSNIEELVQYVSMKDVKPVKRSFIDIIKGWFNHA